MNTSNKFYLAHIACFNLKKSILTSITIFSVTVAPVASVALRLARFNSKILTSDKKYFTGLASPAAAAVMICYAWVIEASNYDPATYVWVSLTLTIGLSYLMISSLTYYSFKDISIRQKVPHVSLFLIVLVLSFISFDPPLVLLSFFTLYAFSGPVLLVSRVLKKKIAISKEKKLL